MRLGVRFRARHHEMSHGGCDRAPLPHHLGFTILTATTPCSPGHVRGWSLESYRCRHDAAIPLPDPSGGYGYKRIRVRTRAVEHHRARSTSEGRLLHVRLVLHMRLVAQGVQVFRPNWIVHMHVVAHRNQLHP
jgi:hypothetical protein